MSKEAETVINSTASIKKGKSNADLANETKAAQKKFKGEKTVKVNIPTILKAQLGSTIFVSVNGVYVNVPVDGESHAIPETLADCLNEMLKNLK